LGYKINQGKRPVDMPSLFNSKQLEIFQLLALHRNFTLTATNAKVSQSCVSHNIQSLERQVGCRLLDRTSRRVVLTPAGEQFLHHVSRILEEMAAAGSGLERLKNWGQVQLRVSAPAAICDSLLPTCLHDVRSQYPNCSIALVASDKYLAIEHLLSGYVDMAVITGSEPDERFDSQPLFCDELSFVMLPSHPWAHGIPTDAAALSAEPIITFPRNSHSWNLVVHHFRRDRVEPALLVECNSVAGIRRMVRIGMGVGIMASWTVSEEVSRGELVCHTLGGRPLRRRWTALSLRSKQLSLPQLLLISEIRRTALGHLVGVTAPTASAADLECLAHLQISGPGKNTSLPSNWMS